MIRRLTGQPEPIASDAILLDVNGVGYEVLVGPQTRQTLLLQPIVTVHIYTHVREEQFLLFGFAHRADREIFVQMLTVSGVGPKSAIMISDYGASAVVKALQTSDVGFFQGIPRLGKKTAQKIIVELQSKVGAVEELDLSPENSLQRDLREALLGMGYHDSRIETIVRQVDASLDIAQALKWSLQQLGQGAK